MRQGYIKLYRKIDNWEWAKDVKTFRLFIQLLLDANKDDGSWRGVKTERGEVITSIAALASETGLSVREVRTALSHLQKTGEITENKARFYTSIKVVNYGVYQGFEHFEQKTKDKASATKWQPDNKRKATNNNKRIRK